MYVNRSLARGFDRKQVGISWRKYQQLKWVSKIKDYMQKYERTNFLKQL